MKKITVILFLLTASLSVSARDFSLIVAPARYTVMQVMFDVVNNREAVLLSYQGEASTQNPLLHYWNGSAWKGIEVHDLNELRFLNSTPSRVIFVGDDSLLPVVVKDSLAWLPEKTTVTSMSHAGLINELDGSFNWSNREWKWFANRYNLNLEDKNEEKRSRSWFDQPGPIRGPASANTTLAPAPVGTISPEPEPVVVEQTETIQPIPASAVEPASESGKDDLDEVIEMLERERSKSGEAPAEAFPIK